MKHRADLPWTMTLAITATLLSAAALVPAPLLASGATKPVGVFNPHIVASARPSVPAYPKSLGNTVTLTFEGLQNFESVLNFYGGGKGGDNSGPGPAYGITFSANAIAGINASSGGTTNAANEPSPPTSMAFETGQAATMTVAAGFTNGLSFYYSAPFVSGSITLYDGPNATGNILATLSLPETPVGPDPDAPYDVWVPVGVEFSGTARSVDFAGAENYIAFDNIAIGVGTPHPRQLSSTVTKVPTANNSSHVALSQDGSLAVFASQDTDLVANDANTNGQSIFSTGPSGSSVLESVDSLGHQLIGTASLLPAVSGDGNTVAFHFAASAPTQSTGDSTSNMWAGLAGQPKHKVDMAVGGAAPNGQSSNPSLSADGRKLVFCSAASNLVAGDSNGLRDIFLVDPLNETTPALRISTDSGSKQLSGDSCEPRISADGSKVAFTISAPGSYGTSARQVVRKDLASGALELISVSISGPGKGANADSSEPAISADGSVVAFTSQASDLDSLGTPVGGMEAFVSLAQSGADGVARTLKRLRSGDGTVPNGASQHPQLSNDGSIAVLQTSATNFFGSAKQIAATPACGAVVITTNFFAPAALGSSLCGGGASNQNPTISGDGTTAGFDSNASQPGTSSSNNNTYAQTIAGRNSMGVSNFGDDFSGQWYDENQSGQGLVIDVTHPDANNQRTMILTWFVYLNGQPTWVQAVGTPQAGTGAQAGMVVVQMNQVGIFKGRSFPLGEARATASSWGSITLAFVDASSGTMNWTSSYPGFNSGSMPITHFLPVALPADDAPDAQIKACYSGNWFNPAQSGHGFEFEVLPTTPAQLTVDWFAFSPNTGVPVWLFGVGPISGNGAQVPLVLIDGSGAQFPPRFDPAQITKNLWGTATFTFTDSGHAQVSWNSTISGYSSGQQSLQPTLGEGSLDRRPCQ